MTEMTCTAEDVQVKDESSLTNVKILPHKPVTGVHANEIIMWAWQINNMVPKA